MKINEHTNSWSYYMNRFERKRARLNEIEAKLMYNFKINIMI